LLFGLKNEYESRVEDEKDKVRLLLEVEKEEACAKIKEECTKEKDEAVHEVMRKAGLM